jgi:predicted HTH transcriptional regulator
MKTGCIADSLSEPEFDILPAVFSICFKIRDYSQVKNDDQNASFGKNGGVNGGVNSGVNRIKKKILDLMTKNPEITAEQIANTVKTTKRRVEHYINQLKKAGTVERIGADKNGHWLVKSGNKNKV